MACTNEETTKTDNSSPTEPTTIAETEVVDKQPKELVETIDKEPIKEIKEELKPKNPIVAETTPKPSEPVIEEDEPTTSSNAYTWYKKAINSNNTLLQRIKIPTGYKRIAASKGSFADWLRGLPLYEKSRQVHYYEGSVKANNVHEAVVDLDVGKRDLQQCADAIMRLKAEYHFARKEYNEIHFKFTSGDNVKFDDWRKGRKPRISGNKVLFSTKTGKTDNSYRNFMKYMTQIFNYAGTASLSKEMQRVSIKDMQIGDIFIQGGFPGHAILVLDMVENDAGKKMFLLGQSYMPAQDFHILKNFNSADGSPWYPLDFGTALYTPEWEFSSNDLKRFR